MLAPIPAAIMGHGTEQYVQTVEWESYAQRAPNHIMGEGFQLFCHLSISSYSKKKKPKNRKGEKKLLSQKTFNFSFTEEHHLVSPMLEVELIGEKVSVERV